jgi:hypothetical protein
VLDELAAIGPYFAVSAHPPGAAPAAPWRPAGELASPSGALRDRVAAVRATLAARGDRAAADIEPRVAASTVHLGLVARLIAPGLGAAVLGGRLDLRPGGLWWQDVVGGPAPLSVPVSGPAGEWDRLLMDELVAPVTAAIALLAPVSGRVLWGNVASAVNAAAAGVARQRPDLAAAAWQAAGQLFGNRRLEAERHPPGPAFRRSSCCLFYRLALSDQEAPSYPQAPARPRSPARPRVQVDPSAVCGDCVLAGRGTSR